MVDAPLGVSPSGSFGRASELCGVPFVPAGTCGIGPGAAAATMGAAAAAACCTTLLPPLPLPLPLPLEGERGGTGAPTPKRVTLPLSMFDIAAACAPSPPELPLPIGVVAQFHAVPTEETVGVGPPKKENNHATTQLIMAASIPNALVGMWRTCKLSKSDTNPAKIAISGRKTPRNTINVETPDRTPPTVSIIVD